ncbi:hypothetical protein DAERI_120072 [Deinococcus aerius]|uniref:Uncharacterized protein n=1 Tax=Deinococcus aerius TaxID=200253 RepID=A0A2I9CY72_9DEIO|nr:hypothetical protein [Deinococcus aerius]GBF07079.1 hypothetical protein DAERI_120072 [Deinococcus aerius]
MTKRANGGETVVEVRGAWHGEVGDPGRVFEGGVVSSDLPGVPPGSPVTVFYRTAAARVAHPREHGSYVMQVGGRELGLMRFTCHDTGLTGHEGNDDRAEATWQAVTLPG